MELSDQKGQKLELDIVQLLNCCVEQVNTTMNLGSYRVNSQKRRLLITTEGGIYGANVGKLRGTGAGGSDPRLMLTHKRSLRGWMNVQIFKPWLDSLEYSEL